MGKELLRERLITGRLMSSIARPALVMASAAKQSRVVPRRQSGLLRFARNDGVGESIVSNEERRGLGPPLSHLVFQSLTYAWLAIALPRAACAAARRAIGTR